MENKLIGMKDQFENATIVIPHDVWIEKRNGKWYVTCFQRYFCAPISDEEGERLWHLYEEWYKRETWRYKKTLGFKWVRFWYNVRKYFKGE